MGRKAYHEELKKLEGEVMTLADMVAHAVKGSIDALVSRDLSASREIVKNDININNKRYEIEESCLLLIATQQPMAIDLRTIAAMLHIITDLERIADHAEGTAKISLMIGDKPLMKPDMKQPDMAERGISMLNRCMQAFRDRDAVVARAICDEDDIVDDLYDIEYKELIDLMIKNREHIQEATYMIWVAHNLERTADRVTNIAERVVFMATGKMEEINVSSY